MEWIDYLRGITIILVVYYHSLLGIKRSTIAVPAFLDNANLIFLSFRMPLFFILSGIFITKSLERNSVKTLVGKKFELLIYPYLVWSVLQISLQIAFSNYTNSDRSWIDFSYILYQPRGLDQFWYLPALFNCTVAYMLIKRRFAPSPMAQLSFALLLYFASPYFQQVSMISDFMRFYVFFAIGDLVSAFFFRPSSQRFFIRRLSFLLILPLFVFVQVYYLKYDIGGATLTTDVSEIRANWVRYATNSLAFLGIALVGCVTMVKLSFLLQRFRAFSFLRVIGYHSLYIYVMHLVLTAFSRIAFTRFLGLEDPLLLLVVSIVLGTMLPIAFYNLLVKDGPLYFLFSYRRERKKAQPAVKTVTEPRITVGAVLTPTSFAQSQTVSRNP